MKVNVLEQYECYKLVKEICKYKGIKCPSISKVKFDIKDGKTIATYNGIIFERECLNEKKQNA